VSEFHLLQLEDICPTPNCWPFSQVQQATWKICWTAWRNV